ncbi:MAG: nucleotidyl transferase AbiEii/AbiGii toxin family protein [Clostridium sp.]
MNIHQDKEKFKELIEVTAEFMKLDKRIIEKDYWVTYALKKLAKSEMLDKVIFRGGTSLTKCYKDLNRFSEDIDLAVNTNDDMNPSQIKSLIKRVEKVMCSEFNESDGTHIKDGKFRDVEYIYPSIFNDEKNSMNELNPKLKIETVTFMHPNPYEKREVKSFLYEYLIEKNLEKFIPQYELEPFELNVLSIKRTLIDKIVSLVRMSYEKELKEIRGKTRHLYDLHMTYDSVKDFYEDEEELKRIIALTRYDEESEVSRFKDKYPYLEKWHEAPLFSIIDLDMIKDSYEKHFGSEFVYGELPKYELVIKTMAKIKIHLQNIDA